MDEHSITAGGQQNSIDSKLTQLLTKFRSQKAELYALKAEVSVNSQSVASEVKILKRRLSFNGDTKPTGYNIKLMPKFETCLNRLHEH